MSKTNRNKGHTLERRVAKLYQEIFTEANIRTSRYASRELDDKKVDLAGVPMFNVQCKATQHAPQKVLHEMPNDTNHNILHWKDTKQRGKHYVVLEEKDWLEIIQLLNNENII